MSSAVYDLFRWSRGTWSAPRPRAVAGWSAAIAGVVFVGAALVASLGTEELPVGVGGTIVFVSDRSGMDSLYVRRMPGGREERLVSLAEPVAAPALSPDGSQVAFSVGGRVGVVSAGGGSVRILTSGGEWRDESPTWRPDGRALVVAARRVENESRDLHELRLEGGAAAPRRPLLETPFLDESQAVVSPDGQYLVFIREDNVVRWDFRDGRTRRLSRGFRRARAPRFLESGRVLYLWEEGKEFGIDVTDIDGREHETLQRGTAYYRSVVPSPDGRFLAATFTYDLGFDLWHALRHSHPERLLLLDARGAPVAEMANSWRYSNHSADWKR
jgi:Tol biopolymer transport system component